MTDPVAAPAPAPATPQTSSIFDDFLDIFASPGKVFERRATASPALPWLIVTVLLIGLFFANRNAMAPVMDAEMQRGFETAMKNNPQITPDIVEKMKGTSAKFATVGAVVTMPLATLILALFTWGVGRVLGGTLSYGTALTISVFAWVPRVVDSVLVSVQGLLMDTSRLTSHYQLAIGPARFLDPATASPWLLALLGRLDVMTLWVTVLLAIGLSAAGKVPKNMRVPGGVLMWIIGSLPAFYQAFRS